MARRRLRDIQLSRRAARARFTLFVVLAVCSVTAAISYFLPAHAESPSAAVSSFADSPYFQDFLALCGLVAALLCRARFGAGICIGLISFLVAGLDVQRWPLTHYVGDVMHGLGLAAMSLIGVVLASAELVMFFAARSALERADPKIPSARVVG
jgi:hypothetical protein